MQKPLTFRDLANIQSHVPRYTLEWAFGDRFDAFTRAFLIPTDHKITDITCRHHKTFTCNECQRLPCILNTNGTYRTFCPFNVVTSETIPAEKLQTYRTDETKVFSAICAALSLKLSMEKLAYGFFRIAVYSPRMGRSICVYFTYHMSEMAAPLCSNPFPKIPSPFVMLTPYPEDLSPEVLQYLQAEGSKIVRIDDCLSISDTGEISLSVPRSTVLMSTDDDTRFSAQNAPHFDLPPGTTWGDISIHMLDRMTCTITIGECSTKRLLTEMGFKDKDKQSEMFNAFANCNGMLPSHKIVKNDSIKKRLQRLRRILEKFFGLKNPIHLSQDKSVYQCQFKLTPDTRSTLYHPKRT